MKIIPLFCLLLFALTCVAPSHAAIPTRFEASWKAVLPDDSKGYGVALLPDEASAPTPPADWVEPNVKGVLAVGFDTFNPPTKNPFNADGNIDDQPQREVSLHWNGVEVANRFCPVELKGAAGHKGRLLINWVVGGAEVSVFVNGTAVYDHYFVPEAIPYKARFVLDGEATIPEYHTKLYRNGTKPAPAPVHVVAFSHALNDGGHHRNTANVVFPAHTKEQVGRVICTLTLDKTPAGLDPWDRIAALYLYDEAGQRFEILRYMTPYRKAYEWKADVTDFLPLFTGTKKMELMCETYGAGWEVSVSFDFYKGSLKRVPYKVVNLWNTTAIIGQADKPLDKSLPPVSLPYDKEAKQVKMRLCVTGHGQEPNTDNAAEFISLWRKLHVGEKGVYENTLWKADNYLNPCRPQGGTWKYSRAGWAPGDVVTPWIVDITGDLQKKKETTLRYEIQPFVNKTPVDGNPARHIVEAQAIFYK